MKYPRLSWEIGYRWGGGGYFTRPHPPLQQISGQLYKYDMTGFSSILDIFASWIKSATNYSKLPFEMETPGRLARTWVRSHAPSIQSHRGTKVVWPDFQPMRVPEEPVCIDLFRQNPVFTSLHLKSPVHVHRLWQRKKIYTSAPIGWKDCTRCWLVEHKFQYKGKAPRYRVKTTLNNF